MSITLEEFKVFGFIGSLNVTVTALVISTAVAEVAGSVEITPGGVVSGAVDSSHPARIANANTIDAVLHCRSFAPEVIV
ncbi:MAG: hypothetical protein ABI875_06360 [Gemmatimonadales bacterium]